PQSHPHAQPRSAHTQMVCPYTAVLCVVEVLGGEYRHTGGPRALPCLCAWPTDWCVGGSSPMGYHGPVLQNVFFLLFFLFFSFVQLPGTNGYFIDHRLRCIDFIYLLLFLFQKSMYWKKQR